MVTKRKKGLVASLELFAKTRTSRLVGPGKVKGKALCY